MFKHLSVAIVSMGLVAWGVAQSPVMQPNAHLEERTSWNTCVYPACAPGGTTTPTLVDNLPVTNITLDGHAMRFDVGGPAYTDALWYIYTGEYAATAPYGLIDLYAYLPAQSTNAQAFEYDAFEYAGSTRYMFGTQCNQLGDGKWDIWDMLHSQWVATSIPCKLSVNTWHHIQIAFHSGTDRLDGYPAEHYDSITIDGVVNAVNMAEPSGPYPSSWGYGNNAGLNIQLDEGPTGTMVTEYIDKANLMFYGF